MGEVAVSNDAQRLALQRVSEGPTAERTWRWFSSEFASGEQWDPHPDGGEPVAALSLRLLHWRLRRFDSGYNLALDLAHLPRALAPADALWQPLHRSAELQVGLLSVHQGHLAALPLEPLGDTAMLAVSGVVRLERSVANGTCTARRLEPGEFVRCTGPRDALGLEAASVVAVLLVVLPGVPDPALRRSITG
jgi:hypothetical protein